MSDIFEMRDKEWCEALLAEKAKKIVELQAEIERLRAALSGVLWMAEEWFEHGGDETTLADDFEKQIEAANAALDYRKMEGK